jgi:hypothetical protein
VLLLWRDAKLAHVEALDEAHFADDRAYHCSERSRAHGIV